MHSGVIRQTVWILNIKKNDVLRTGDRDILQFRFCFHSEFLKEGSMFLLREGRTKILGTVTKVFGSQDDMPMSW